MADSRINNEVEHGKFLAAHNAPEIWGWSTPAGQIRWKRRVNMLTSKLKPGYKVLEVGCGTGFFTKEIAKLDIILEAIDISPELIEIAKEQVTGSRVTFHVVDACNTGFEDGTFDAIIGSSVLHHLDTERAIPEFYRILKPGGFVSFTEPNMLNPQIAIQKNIPWVKKAMGDSPDETAFFQWVISKKMIKAGFSQVNVIPFDFLHPGIPEKLIRFIKPLANFAEKVPILKLISGSLLINAVK